jgi:TPP-dependent pyruvate/acetoin dehydrogenase alpha subunit
MKGHAEHDDMKYVPQEQLNMWALRDPIVLFERFLLDNGMAVKDLEAIATRAEEELVSELASAEASPMPLGPSGRTDVYFGSTAEDPTPEIVRRLKSGQGSG